MDNWKPTFTTVCAWPSPVVTSNA